MTSIKIDPTHLEETLWELFLELFDWDPEDQIFVTCIKVLAEHEVEPMDLILLSSEELHQIYLQSEERYFDMSPRMSSIVRSLQLYLKNLQEKGLF